MTNEIDRLADFLLSTYPDRIGAGDFRRGESAVDVAIRLLTPQGCGHPAVCIWVGEEKAPGEFVHVCGWCECSTYQVHDLERRLTHMAEALEGVVEHVAPFVRAILRSYPDQEADKALERVETALLLKVGR